MKAYVVVYVFGNLWHVHLRYNDFKMRHICVASVYLHLSYLWCNNGWCIIKIILYHKPSYFKCLVGDGNAPVDELNENDLLYLRILIK
jgi:hypothetical protein